MPLRFQDSVAAVTGAASGIGRATALAFAREGADIVVSDINDEGGKALVSEIEALGRDAIYVHTDVAKRDEVEDLVRTSIEWKGHCDLFHSNAGIGMGGAPHMIPVDEWERVLDINLHSHIWAVRKILPHMLERGTGHLVHTASSAGTIGFAMLVPYCVTKFGVVGLCESLAGYVHDRGVGVSVVCPLLVATNIWERSVSYQEEGAPSLGEDREKLLQQRFMEAGMPPEQVADEIVRCVKENRLYVFPHPELKTMIDSKWADPDAFVANLAQQLRVQQETIRALQAAD